MGKFEHRILVIFLRKVTKKLLVTVTSDIIFHGSVLPIYTLMCVNGWALAGIFLQSDKPKGPYGIM